MPTDPIPRIRPAAAVLAAAGLLGCQVPGLAPAGTGTLTVSVRWPARTVQAIPLSTQTIWLRVVKGSTTAYSGLLSRPAANGLNPLVGSTSCQLDAGTGYSVLADCYATASTASTSIASGSTTATVVANQKATASLTLNPVFTPTLTSFSPTNGGPGTPVTLVGTFGSSGFYAISMSGASGPARTSGSLVSGNISTQVPVGALTGPISAMADGVLSAATGSFTVVASLSVSPQGASTTVGTPVSYSATARDTGGLPVSSPTITWETMDPASVSNPRPSPIGTINSSTGQFNPTSTGSAWIRVWSGNVVYASTSVVVN